MNSCDIPEYNRDILGTWDSSGLQCVVQYVQDDGNDVWKFSLPNDYTQFSRNGPDTWEYVDEIGYNNLTRYILCQSMSFYNMGAIDYAREMIYSANITTSNMVDDKIIESLGDDYIAMIHYLENGDA